MNDHFEQTIRRTRGYWDIDGLPELGLGLLCLIMASFFYIQSSLEAGTLLSQLLNLFLILLVIGGGLASNRLITFLKQRITYPRTGYVKYRSSPLSRRVLLGLAGVIISGSLVILLSFTDLTSFWMPFLTALIFSIVFIFVGNRRLTPRYYFFALISLGFGVGVGLAGLKDLQGLAVYYGGVGMVLSISGGIVFRNFLAAHDLSEEEEQ